MQIEENIPLLPYNTFRIDVKARYLARIRHRRELEEQGSLLSSLPAPPLVLGGGSNLLFTKDVDGWVLKNEIGGIETEGEDDESVYVSAGGGLPWQSFVMHCVEAGLGGVENLSLIPGSCGAAPMQNIGAYGVELQAVFHSLEAWHLKDRAWVNFSADACRFGYRDSIFKQAYKGQLIITRITCRLQKSPKLQLAYGAIREELDRAGVTSPDIRDVAAAVTRIRMSKLPDPNIIGNAGSFFKNPEIEAPVFKELQHEYPGIIGYSLPSGRVKVAAGWLIETAGWKGHRKGDAGCHDKQALVLVNHGHASGQEILSLAAEIQQDIQYKFGIPLEREVNVY